MAMPKSVTRINKKGITYTSYVDQASYTIKELTRAALKDSAKIIRYHAKKLVPVDTGTLKSNIGTWVRYDKITNAMWLQIGVYDAKTSKKKGKTPAYHTHLLEFGTRKMAAQPFLTPSVFDHIDEIRDAQAQYLSAIETEQNIKSLIDERDEQTDD